MRRVLCAVLSHETNTFSKDATDLASFQKRDFYLGNQIPAARRGTRSNFGGSFEAADKYGWRLIHPVIASANPSGTVTRAAFEHLTGLILDAVDQAGGIDAALLHLHGAMVADGFEDAEGELLRRLREKVGQDVPIAVTLDLHGNITPLMAETANALVGFKTYPHIDQYERAWQAAEILERTMNGEIAPRVVLARRKMLTGLDMGRTQGGPMKELVDEGIAIERSGELLNVSVFAGFPHSDIADVGPSVAIAYDAKAGKEGRAREVAERFMDRCWETRDYAALTFLTPEAAARKAKAEEAGATKPLIIADYTDNPGGGGYGDTTALLKAMVDADLQNAAFHAICDPSAIAEGVRAGVGNSATITLGGKWDPTKGGGPLTLTGKVRVINDGEVWAYGPMGGGVRRDYGLSLVFRVGGIDIVLITNNGQALDLGQYTALGIDPTRKATVAVKSMHHFRAAFQPISREVVVVDSGSLCSENFAALPYRNVRRPVWPLDPIADPH
ncbi:MAG: M81 family metallopeptidase [Alphaproteobacteria bacterium]|nr:M81 family metallopeptidase [Alphaproteobacteria bacterium]